MHEPRQHTAIQSVSLHLIPGMVILGLIFLFSNPLFSIWLGIDENLSPVTGYLLAILFGLLPVQLIILLMAGKYETGKFRIKDIIPFTERSAFKVYLLYIPGLIVYFLLLLAIVAPMVQPFIIDTFFSWWPQQYNFQLILQDPSGVAGYSGVEVLLAAYFLLSCILGPVMEEVYFRGYLLPRMNRFSGKWAPLLNAVLFSLYHFFSPWENPVRIAASFPLVYLVWKERNIRIGIWVHVFVNTIGAILMSIIILSAG